MASVLQSSYPLGSNMIVTKEEFFIFHNIDRQLFTRLVMELGHDTSQSIHVMAFIMWLEKHSKDMKMVKNMLQWPHTMLDTLVNEATMVLNCIESSQFLYDDDSNDKGLPLIKSIMQNNGTSFKYFYNNRVTIIHAVTKLLNDVCVRAFTDIVQQVQYMKAVKEYNSQIANTYGTNSPYMKQVAYYTPLPGVTIVPQQVAILTPQQSEENSRSLVGIHPPIEAYDVSNKEEFHKNFNELLASLNQTSITTSNNSSNQISDTIQEVPIDDRIIFMTFSKGYPIEEAEVVDFFSRACGNIVEALYMQDVAPSEQPLYACVVIHEKDVHMVNRLLESKNKVKLSINGKHAWARKYVPKGNKSPQTKSPTTSRAPSPSSRRPSY